jgi:hypothetical protein
VKLLRIDSSPFRETAISRRLNQEFVQRWLDENHGGAVITRDLATTAIPVVDAAWVSANYSPKRSCTQTKRNSQTLGRIDRGTKGGRRIRHRTANPQFWTAIHIQAVGGSDRNSINAFGKAASRKARHLHHRGWKGVRSRFTRRE